MPTFTHTPEYELRRSERLRTVRVLTRRGESAEAIARRLGVSPRTVFRYRRGLPVAQP